MRHPKVQHLPKKRGMESICTLSVETHPREAARAASYDGLQGLCLHAHIFDSKVLDNSVRCLEGLRKAPSRERFLLFRARDPGGWDRRCGSCRALPPVVRASCFEAQVWGQPPLSPNFQPDDILIAIEAAPLFVLCWLCRSLVRAL